MIYPKIDFKHEQNTLECLKFMVVVLFLVQHFEKRQIKKVRKSRILTYMYLSLGYGDKGSDRWVVLKAMDERAQTLLSYYPVYSSVLPSLCKNLP